MTELLHEAQALDTVDELAAFRNRFYIPKRPDGSDVIYLCGNSLGLQPKSVSAYVDEMLLDWREMAVEAHFKAAAPWMPYHELVAAPLARLTGALPSEVVAMNSLTINLHLMMVSFYRPTKDRYKILIEAGAFPSDQYAVASQIKYHGFDPRDAIIEAGSQAVNSPQLTAEAIEQILFREGDRIALILFGGVNYLSGQLFDLERIARAGHQAGAVVGFDLAHAIGNVPLQMHDWEADFAVWCSYKYLNSGPGGIGGAFVHERHHHAELPRFAGWWGHDKKSRFRMPHDFSPIFGAEGWQLSNPPILPLAALRASLAEFDSATIERLRAKSIHLTGYLERLLDEARIPGLEILTPRAPEQRGAQLSLRVPGGRSLFDKLTDSGVVCDWREPDVMRVAPVPLYNSFNDVFQFVELLKSTIR